jgi:crotonobetainyl-CoA:carnitine CoA-transferase CaiB-like acyl-CoA transferase
MEAKVAEKSFGPLQGVRVLERGSSVSGPFCGRLLADFGAEVIKVEIESGDPVRSMSKRVQGRSLYAASIFRNKELVSINLRDEDGRELVRQLSEQCDIVVENFRPGTLHKWGLGYEDLAARNPGLVMVHISGFGQSGPYRERAGYGAIGDAISGLRHLTGDPDRPPARIAASVVDEVTGLYGALGAVMALRVRDQTGQGQEVDSALYESAFSLVEPHVPVYGKLGIVPTRVGSRLPDSAPNNLYVAQDGHYVHITAMGDSVFMRLAQAMNRPDLALDPLYQTGQARSANEEDLDRIIGQWAVGYTARELERMLEDNGVPAARIYDMADVFKDEHFLEREMLVKVQDPVLGELTVPGIVPKLSRTPGRVVHAGRDIGQNTHEVLERLLGMDVESISKLEASRAIFCGALKTPKSQMEAQP